MASIWDIYDSYCVQNETQINEKADNTETAVNTFKGQEKRSEKSSSSTVCTGNKASENVDNCCCILFQQRLGTDMSNNEYIQNVYLD